MFSSNKNSAKLGLEPLEVREVPAGLNAASVLGNGDGSFLHEMTHGVRVAATAVNNGAFQVYVGQARPQSTQTSVVTIEYLVWSL